jgi:hypothetical protein
VGRGAAVWGNLGGPAEPPLAATRRRLCKVRLRRRFEDDAIMAASARIPGRRFRTSPRSGALNGGLMGRARPPSGRRRDRADGKRVYVDREAGGVGRPSQRENGGPSRCCNPREQRATLGRGSARLGPPVGAQLASQRRPPHTISSSRSATEVGGQPDPRGGRPVAAQMLRPRGVS